MPSLAQRMRKLHTKLLAIRLGPGALVLPKEVKRIHMRFAARMEGGHMGPRKFWRHELVRLKYHNPAVPMVVDRHNNNSNETDTPDSSEAVMTISFAPSDAIQTSSSPTSSPAPIDSTSTTTDTPASDHTPAERVETINMKHRTNSEILQELVRITRAYPIEPTVEEQQELRLLEEQRVRGERDRRSSLEARARVKRERELLEQARGELAREPA